MTERVVLLNTSTLVVDATWGGMDKFILPGRLLRLGTLAVFVWGDRSSGNRSLVFRRRCFLFHFSPHRNCGGVLRETATLSASHNSFDASRRLVLCKEQANKLALEVSCTVHAKSWLTHPPCTQPGLAWPCKQPLGSVHFA